MNMDEQKKQALIEKLRDITSTMPDASIWQKVPPPSRTQVVEGGVVFLAGQGLETFEQLYKQFEKERGWREKFSREHIEEEVIFPLLSCVLQHENVNQLLDTLVSQCDNYLEAHTAYIPIEMVEMEIDELELGNITLRNMRGKHFNTFTQQVESELVRRAATQEEQERDLKRWRKWVRPLLKGKIVAAYTTVAEPFRVQELAEQECAHVIDVLRYFIFVSKKDSKSNLGLPGELGYGWSEVAIASSTYGFSTRSEPRGSQRFRITQQTLQAMKDAGVHDLLDMYRPGKKTDFSDTLLTGIHWVANALIQTEPANEFLSLVSCLETFLTRDAGDTGSISNAIAVGVAWVLGQNFAERQVIRKEMKKLYDKRSSITHGGQQDELVDDLLVLRERVRAFAILPSIRHCL
jgi:hypothetical protein